jgi:valyl-tRNA synthetase
MTHDPSYLLKKTYVPSEIESKWYQFWETSGYFKPNSEKSESYCIQLPPPNVTGTLHMGHGFQQTIMDILVRYHRMNGKETLWQPGVDHAGIATQIVVERELEKEGLTKQELGREKFLEKVWEWKEYSGGSIVAQMKRLGASCDWSRERFTMDEGLSYAVREVFVKLYHEGLIYRGKRLVNWDPKLQTAVSDLEVLSDEEDGFMWHIHYPMEDGSRGLVVATTRPETLLGDVAVAVHPDDERYQSFIGKKLLLPLSEGKTIPIISDTYVDPSFGTGCVKITPGHDFNDYAVGIRHSLPIINIFTLDAKLNDLVPTRYQGLSRELARRMILDELTQQGLLEKTQHHKLMIPRGDRSGEIIEPMLTDQWFMNMQDLAKDALNCVHQGDIHFVPDSWSNTYNQWLNNIQDWCISRQLWWGHRIPAWYHKDGRVIVAHSIQEASKQASCLEDDLTQDEDVLDTWFSSALWCFSTLGWPEKTQDLDRFLPSSVLVTGFDIIFFWVARMVMMTRHFTKQVPFKYVYINPIIRDAHGQKMSKSKGNVIDPIDMVDGISLEDLISKRTSHLMNPNQAKEIAQQTTKDYPQGFIAFGADALRFTFASIATQARYAGFDIKRIEGYRNFCNKLWNATRFVIMNVKDSSIAATSYNSISWIDQWMISRFQRCILSVRQAIETYRFDFAAQELYECIWNDFCDWYLELSKIQLKEKNSIMAMTCRRVLIDILEQLIQLLHPIMPFITEELWHDLRPYSVISSSHGVNSIMLSSYPEYDSSLINEDAEEKFLILKSLVGGVRELRAITKLSPGSKINVDLYGEKSLDPLMLTSFENLAKISSLNIYKKQYSSDQDSPVIVCGSYQLVLNIEIDPKVELARIEKLLKEAENDGQKLRERLNKPGYIDKAPRHLVERDQKSLETLEQKIVQLSMQKSKLVI